MLGKYLAIMGVSFQKGVQCALNFWAQMFMSAQRGWFADSSAFYVGLQLRSPPDTNNFKKPFLHPAQLLKSEKTCSPVFLRLAEDGISGVTSVDQLLWL